MIDTGTNDTLNSTLLRIKEISEERHWSLYRLSKESGIPYTTLRNLFIRNNEPTLETVRRICNCFGISLSDFLGDDKPNIPQNDYTADEKNLIIDYRSLNRSNRNLLLTYIAGLKRVLPDSKSYIDSDSNS